jgi:hypothetical protein
MILQGDKDQSVPEAAGYDIYYPHYKDDARFSFNLYEGRAHFDTYYNDASRAYMADYVAKHTDATTNQVDYSAYDQEQGCILDDAVMSKTLQFYEAEIV